MKRIAVLGSTGSIGTNTLNIARHLGPDAIRVTALAAKSNIDLLEQQAREFFPELIAVYDKNKARTLQKRLPRTRIVSGEEGLNAVATYVNAEMIISAITGTLGLPPTLAAIVAGKNVGLANKEALVSGGALLMAEAKKRGVSIIPIDSEHSALFQCLQGAKLETVKRLILTASGGPFRTLSSKQLQTITVDQALAHPTWKMGPKVTIDSSTLMNKGLELIEAHWLFGIPVENIEVVVHPQSIVHSMVEFIDNSILAQMGEPDMRTPIQYAMTYPERKAGILPPFDFMKNPSLQFFQADKKKFSCLELAYDAIKAGGTLPCFMNAANEILVGRFLQKQISWQQISGKLRNLMEKHSVSPIHGLEDILAVDSQARTEASLI